ncbi:phosphatidate cytidylyltransferase [Rubellicoccus peritrichatus]|uniref:Phosphatidate cytidylyltransferase n=1 Tax=Rubellicoccus peritrichatus TaxID=3080537 RepID=A0AAQ3LEF4_9BACT|nr:phosphatidate cytidylyltransferase [Puniceicoccus sp. CR14]WOO43044.1 phosphatidate cytidylyltransferase [Puniceicoccus sp. CR14]
MKNRILSTVALWAAVIIILLVLGNTGGVLLIVALSCLTQWEFYTLLERTGEKPLKIYGVILGAALLLGSYYITAGTSHTDIFVVCVLLLSASVLYRPNFGKVFLPTLVGIVYVPFMFQFFGFLLQLHGTLILPIWIIAVAKFSDVGALLIGSKFGRIKLAPKISPGKTVEGAAGGILTSVLVGLLLILLFSGKYPVGFGMVKAGFVAACIGTVAIVSDLIESTIKRQAGVKDSGNLIPGIGGAFDLTDSLILSAPVGYLLIKYFF